MQNFRAAILPVLAAALAATLVSCASVQAPPRQNAGDCLVILPSKLNNPTGFESPRYYELSFSNGEKNLRLPKTRTGYAFVVTHQSGEFISGLDTGIEGQRRRVSGDSLAHPVTIALPYEAGKAVVWSGTFVQSMVKTADQSFLSDIDIAKTTPEESATLLQELRAAGKLEGWD